MITLDMKKKAASVTINTGAFNLENDILTLEISVGDYDLTGKTITAVFSPKAVETSPLTVNAEGKIQLPIYASEVQQGVNYIQLNFRWGTNKLEQSPVMMWVIDKSLETTAPAQEQVDIITYLIAQYNQIKADYEAAESLRVNEEIIRKEDEELRKTDEITRQTNETERQSNEVERIEADVLRGQTVEAIEQNYAPRLTSVESSLADKANQTALETEITNRTNDVNTEEADRKAEIAVERARINSFTTLVAGSTTGDAELIDARIGGDGVTYTNAGGAVRNQINQAKKNITYLNDGLMNIEYTVTLITNNTRAISDSLNLKVGEYYTFTCDSNYLVRIDYNGGEAYGYASSYTIPIITGTYIIRVKKSDESTFTITDVKNNVHITHKAEWKESDETLQLNIDNVNNKIISPVTVTVDINGSGDYISLRTCLENISPTEKKPYIVQILSGIYDIRADYTVEERSASGFSGLYVPNYTTLIGIGGKENTQIKWDGSLDAANTLISTLNLRNVASIIGLTVYANNIRYAVHDDFAIAGDNIRICKNCDFIGDNITLNHIYGAGHKGGADWKFINCTFTKNIGTGIDSMVVHNAINDSKESNIEFENCRFWGTDHVAVYLSSLNTGTTALTHAIFKGCKLLNANSYIRLNENNASLYGTGIKFKVSGYGNSFDNTKIAIDNTDSIDYLSYVDFI